MNESGRLLLFVAATIIGFVYICNVVPQIKSEPAVLLTPVIGESPDELVRAGRNILMSDRAQCLTCHSLEEDPKARCPNLDGIGETASQRRPGVTTVAYLVESLYNPNAFVVQGYPKDQMTPVNRPPISLSHDEILALIAFLNSLGRETTAAFIEQARKAQDPWRQGILRPEEGTGRATLPIFEGDPERGRQVFNEMSCLQCHRLGAEGRDVGPDLTTIGASQGPEYILESIIDPTTVIVRGYKQVNVIWKEPGRITVRGVPLEWIPDKERPRALRLSLDEYGEQVERQIDLAEVEAVGDTIVGTQIGDEFRRVCGEYVSGDEETGLLLMILEQGQWIEQQIPAQQIQFVNYPTSPMPANFAEMFTPRQVYDLVASLVARKGQL